jgi:hypothetical protein
MTKQPSQLPSRGKNKQSDTADKLTSYSRPTLHQHSPLQPSLYPAIHPPIRESNKPSCAALPATYLLYCTAMPKTHPRPQHPCPLPHTPQSCLPSLYRQSTAPEYGPVGLSGSLCPPPWGAAGRRFHFWVPTLPSLIAPPTRALRAPVGPLPVGTGACMDAKSTLGHVVVDGHCCCHPHHRRMILALLLFHCSQLRYIVKVPSCSRAYIQRLRSKHTTHPLRGSRTNTNAPSSMQSIRPFKLTRSSYTSPSSPSAPQSRHLSCFRHDGCPPVDRLAWR